jgi:FkbM family methyltransferase
MSTSAPAPVDTQWLRLSHLKQRGWWPMQILDVGAHKGDWARVCQSVFPGTDIFMVEADARHERDLRATGFPYHVGVVGGAAGEVDFHTLPELSLTQGASIYRENTVIYDEIGTTITLPVLPLDDVVAGLGCDAISFLKMDVQGAEMDVLRGASRLLTSHPIDFILAELSLVRYNEGAPLAHEVIAYVSSLGFGVHDVFELHYFEDQLIQMDVLFARPQFLTSRVLSHPAPLSGI